MYVEGMEDEDMKKETQNLAYPPAFKLGKIFINWCHFTAVSLRDFNYLVYENFPQKLPSLPRSTVSTQRQKSLTWLDGESSTG